MTRQQALDSIHALIIDQTTPYALRTILQAYRNRDPVDAANDLEHAARLFRDLVDATASDAGMTRNEGGNYARTQNAIGLTGSYPKGSR